jgi:PAS domain S-box-containing protein
MKTDRINSLLIVSIMLTIISGIITYYAVKESEERVDIVLHTREVMQESSALLSLLKDAETAHRDYLLSHDSAFLKAYHTAKEQLQRRLDNFKGLVYNAGQVELLANHIEPLIHRKFHALELLEEADANKNLQALVLSHRQTDSLHTYLDRFNRQEEALLARRMETLQNTLSRQRKIRYMSFILIGLTSVLALITITKKQARNKELIALLNEINIHLEEKVRERTLALQQKHELAEKLNADLQNNFETLESFYRTLQVKNIKAEDTLQEIEYLYNNVNCGYHSLDSNGLIVRMNQTELNWLGYRLEEVVGKLKLEDIIAPEEVPAFREKFPVFMKTGAISNMKHHYVRKDGTMFPVLINSTALYDEHHQYIMSRATVIDISDQEEAEKKLIQANSKLLHFNEEKNHFLGVAAHDLRTPLNTILGLITLFKLKNENLTAEQLEYIQYMEKSCTSMQLLISDLLDINRIEQGLNTLHPSQVSLITLLNQQVHAFKESATKKNISLILEDSPDVMLTTDAEALCRVFENLLSNAIKFSPQHTDVRIRVTNHLTHVRVDVIDHGPGILKEEMGMLFNKFQRLSARPTGGESSSGLGLSIVKELITTLQGKITVESEFNKGTTFTVELPNTLVAEEVFQHQDIKNSK